MIPLSLRAARWQRGGRVLPMLDCWGFVRLLLQSRGIDVPLFDPLRSAERSAALESLDWREVDIAPGVLATCWKRSAMRHVGLVLSSARVAHMTPQGCRVDTVQNFANNHQIRCYTP